MRGSVTGVFLSLFLGIIPNLPLFTFFFLFFYIIYNLNIYIYIYDFLDNNISSKECHMPLVLSA